MAVVVENGRVPSNFMEVSDKRDKCNGTDNKLANGKVNHYKNGHVKNGLSNGVNVSYLSIITSWKVCQLSLLQWFPARPC